MKINPRAKTEINTGFGTLSSNYGGRFLKKNGQPNISKKGIGYFERISWYHLLIDMPRWKFFVSITLFYLFVNFVFATIYYSLGAGQFGGTSDGGRFKHFLEAFFFSSQSFTVGGYGRVEAGNLLINAICGFEAFLGLLTLAVVTGLMYGRFSKPTAFIKFSENALLAPFNGGKAIMLRVAPFKNNILSDAEVNLTLGLELEKDGRKVNRFYPLTLEYNHVNSLTLNWTIVHPITETSPFYNFEEEDFRSIKGEIIVLLKAFDDMFSNTVVARTSYTFAEIIPGAKFNPMYQRSDDNQSVLLHLDKINEYSKIE